MAISFCLGLFDGFYAVNGFAHYEFHMSALKQEANGETYRGAVISNEDSFGRHDGVNDSCTSWGNTQNSVIAFMPL